MTFRLFTKTSLFAVLVFVLALAAPARSQDQSQGFAKQGGFAGVSFLPNFAFDAVTFDGQTIYQEINGDEMAILPRLDARSMPRLVLGYRWRPASIEFSYERTSPSGTFLGVPVETTFQTVNLDGRLFFATRYRIQPHLLLGASLPFFSVKDGSAHQTSVGDAKYRGYGVNSEAGVTMYPHRQFAVSVGYSYRAWWFDRMTGVTNTLFELRPRFRETSGTVVVTSYVIF